MPVPDYPAAHSMDTQWFCVDAHGRVALFDTGEDGALPNAAAIGLGPADPSFDVELLEVIRLANTLGRGRDPRPEREDGTPFPPTPGRQVLVIDDAQLAGGLLGADELLVVRSAGPTVLLTRGELDVERARALARRPGVRWVASTADLYELLEHSEGDDGLFHFHRDHGDDPGLYSRTDAPDQPIMLADLPAPIRGEIAGVTLPVDFAADGSVHLADHIDPSEASTWGDLPLRYSDAPQPPAQPVPARGGKPSLVAMTVVVVVVVVVLIIAALWASQ